MTQMPIDQIVVGERRREDLGDIAGLAASIEKYGLFHSIVVDPRGRLVAGGRRLAACQSLGMKWVEVRQWDDLSDAELREIELEENLRRKDLTEAERSRTLVARVEAAREIAKNEPDLRTDSVRKSPHRPITPGSYRDVSRRIETPVQTIRDAEKHVAAVEAYPELESLPQSTAIKAARELMAMPEEARAVARERIEEAVTNDVTPGDVLRVALAVVPGARETMDAHDLREQFIKAARAFKDRLQRIAPEDAAEAFNDDPLLDSLLADMDDWSRRCQAARRSTLRAVK